MLRRRDFKPAVSGQDILNAIKSIVIPEPVQPQSVDLKPVLEGLQQVQQQLSEPRPFEPVEFIPERDSQGNTKRVVVQPLEPEQPSLIERFRSLYK